MPAKAGIQDSIAPPRSNTATGTPNLYIGALKQEKLERASNLARPLAQKGATISGAANF